MEYTGYAPAWEAVVLRGNPAEAPFAAFWLAGGFIAAALTVNLEESEQVAALVGTRPPKQIEWLSDTGIDLGTVLAEESHSPHVLFLGTNRVEFENGQY
jgi:hypothetical protein